MKKQTLSSLSLTLAAALAACGGSEKLPADTSAAPTKAAGGTVAADEADPKAAANATPKSEVPGVPAAPRLAPLAKPGGPSAEGNVSAYVQAVNAAKSCVIKDGEFVDCPATEAFDALPNNWVAAKAPAHAQTMLNLLGAKESQTRLLVLLERPVDYIGMFVEERKDDPKIYEPFISAALAETDPQLRGYFAYQVVDIPVFEEHANLIPYLGALAEKYSEEEEVHKILDHLGELWDEDCAACRDAVLGAAARNPDEGARLAALEVIEQHEVPSATLCPLILANIHPNDEEALSEVAATFTAETPDCSAHYDAWFATFPVKAREGTLSVNAVHAVLQLIEHERGEAAKPKIRALGRELLVILKEENEIRDAAADLAEIE